MLDPVWYIHHLAEMLKTAFGERLRYIGLQGSYLRGEATENSDIDIMVVIENLSVPDLRIYRQCIESLGNFEKSCGFICSTEDLKKWNPLEICNLIHGTKDYYGNLRAFVPAYSTADVYNYAKVSLNNLYHELSHRYIHADREDNITKLPFSYKSTFFILQTVYYLKTGNFVSTKRELLEKVNGQDQEVLRCAMAYPVNEPFEKQFALLFSWCQNTLKSL